MVSISISYSLSSTVTLYVSSLPNNSLTLFVTAKVIDNSSRSKRIANGSSLETRTSSLAESSVTSPEVGALISISPTCVFILAITSSSSTLSPFLTFNSDISPDISNITCVISFGSTQPVKDFSTIKSSCMTSDTSTGIDRSAITSLVFSSSSLQATKTTLNNINIKTNTFLRIKCRGHY